MADLWRPGQLPILVGYQLRYHPHFRMLREWVGQGRLGKLTSCLAEVGQWLPDWRPEQDYRKSYSAHADQGGGVVFDLSHELDLVAALLGQPRTVSAVLGRYSTLETSAEDVAEVTMQHDGNIISHVHLDCVQRTYTRSFKLIGTEGTAVWNYADASLLLVKPGGETERYGLPTDFSKDTLYRSQLQHWLEILAGTAAPEVDFAQGLAVANIALAAHRSAREGKHERI